MKTIPITFHAVGNFCVYPRKGVTIARFGGVDHAALFRAAYALGFSYDEGGVVVGPAQGYDAKPTPGPDASDKVDAVVAWVARHPEAVNGRPQWRDDRDNARFNAMPPRRPGHFLRVLRDWKRDAWSKFYALKLGVAVTEP